MRIWDVPVGLLCRNHLLGEHRELHAIWSIVTTGKKGYANHPETRRWRKRLKALYLRHEELVKEMENRGYKHHSRLDKRKASGEERQTEFVDSPESQRHILKNKNCDCRI